MKISENDKIYVRYSDFSKKAIFRHRRPRCARAGWGLKILNGTKSQEAYLKGLLKMNKILKISSR